MDGFWLIVAVAGAAAVASPVGGIIAVLVPTSTLFLSIAVGMAGGILMGTLAFEMLPTALENLAVWLVVLACAVGFALTYGLELIVNRGRVAGPAAAQQSKVQRFHRRNRPFGTQVTVLAAATAIEELIEGLSIGVGGAIGTGTALVIGVAICIDNVSEALSIGALAREQEGDEGKGKRQTLFWTTAIGVSLFASAMAGWFLLQGVPLEVLAFLLALGGGAMFYLTVTDLLPNAEQHQYQQSSAWAALAGFLIAFILSQWN